MRSTERRSPNWLWAALFSTLVLGGGGALAHWWQAPQLTVVRVDASFTVPITERGGRAYVSVNDVLEKLGAVEVSGNKKVALRFNAVQAEFENGKSEARIGDTKVEFNGKAVVENGRVLVPATAMRIVLPSLVNTTVEYREASQQLLLGDAGIRFALELKKSHGTELILSFSTPVSPQISTEPGKLKMVFQRDPLAMGSQSWQFDDAVITSASFAEMAESELTVVGSEPLLATFSDGGKTIVVAAAPSAAESSGAETRQVPGPSPTDTTSAGGTVDQTRSAAATSTSSSGRQDTYLVVIDASHGGSERGAALSEKLAEKDVTLAIARSLRKQLDERGLSSLMVRDGDNTATLDQRAELANTSQAAVYVAIHAGGLKRGVQVYTSMLTAADAPTAPPIPWEKAQAGFVQNSEVAASAILSELGKNQVRVPSASLRAPVRPLNNIAAPAVAIEVGPAGDDLESVSDANYHESIAKGVAAALTTVRPRLERRR